MSYRVICPHCGLDESVGSKESALAIGLDHNTETRHLCRVSEIEEVDVR